MRRNTSHEQRQQIKHYNRKLARIADRHRRRSEPKPEDYVLSMEEAIHIDVRPDGTLVESSLPRRLRRRG
jgi:hypothetical protein